MLLMLKVATLTKSLSVDLWVRSQEE
jgi:hypothetical protein